MEVENKNLYVTDAEWKRAISSDDSNQTMKAIFTKVVENGGAVRVLMPDGSSIAKSMDTKAEVNQFFETGN